MCHVLVPTNSQPSVPPVGVYIVAGCGADLLINVCLTLLGYIPGHIHAFYLEYVYYERKETVLKGGRIEGRAAGVYSDRVQSGGVAGYGTIQGGAAPPAY